MFLKAFILYFFYTWTKVERGNSHKTKDHTRMELHRNCTSAVTSNASFGDNKNASDSPSMIATFLLVLMAVFIVIINCLVVFLVWKKKVLRSPANICLTSLACLDFLSGSCAIPLVIACTVLEADYGPRCLSMDFISRMLSISAILHLLAIAVERYVVIVRHVKPDDFFSLKKYIIVVSAVWLIPSCASLIQLSWVEVKDGVPQSLSVSRTEIIYDIVCIFGFVCVPLLIIIVAYVKVFCVLRRHSKEIEKQAMLFVSYSRQQRHKLKEKRATLIYASMIGFYIIGWFPYFLISLSIDLDGGQMIATIPNWVNHAFLFCRFSSSLVDPILYTFFKQDFKEAICSIRRGSRSASGDTESSRPFNAYGNAIQLRCMRHSASTIVET